MGQQCPHLLSNGTHCHCHTGGQWLLFSEKPEPCLIRGVQSQSQVCTRSIPTFTVILKKREIHFNNNNNNNNNNNQTLKKKRMSNGLKGRMLRCPTKRFVDQTITGTCFIRIWNRHIVSRLTFSVL